MTTSDIVNGLRARDQRDTGRTVGVDNIERLAQLDRNALSVRIWDSTIIPGNLQTPAYSAAMIRAANPHMSAMEVRRHVLAKAQRAQAFMEGLAEKVHTRTHIVIGERAITHGISEDLPMHRQQLEALLTLEMHPQISVRVLPDSGPVPGFADQFALYQMVDVRVAYIETVMAAWYSTRSEDVAKLVSVFTDISQKAMSRSSSAEFIREAMSSWQSAKKTSPEHSEVNLSGSLPTAARETIVSASRDSQPRAAFRMER